MRGRDWRPLTHRWCAPAVGLDSESSVSRVRPTRRVIGRDLLPATRIS
jgi:hypothetical protein